MRELLPYQKRAVAYSRSMKNSALFMEMRLGKTLVTIRRLKGYGRILVVGPMEALWAWQRELEMEKESYTILRGPKEKRYQAAGEVNSWFLINYEALLATPEILKDYLWNAFVVDESRRIANPKAKITKLLNSIPHGSEIRTVLCGLPAPESPLEYFEQYRFLFGSFMGCENYWQFRNGYFMELGPHDWVPKPRVLDKLKQEIHKHAFFLSRKEAGIPDRKIYETRTVQFPPEIRKSYNEIKKDFMCSAASGIEISTKWVPVQYIWLHQLANGFLGEKLLWSGKLSALLELLKGELKNEQVVVWFRFNSGIDAAIGLLRESNITSARITGLESRTERENAINLFRQGRLRVLLCQIKCGKTAIDLSNSSTAIYFSNSYSLEDRRQSEDRILNPLKKDPLLYIDLLTEKTVEQDILEALRMKNAEERFFKSKLLEKFRNDYSGN